MYHIKSITIVNFLLYSPASCFTIHDVNSKTYHHLYFGIYRKSENMQKLIELIIKRAIFGWISIKLQQPSSEDGHNLQNFKWKGWLIAVRGRSGKIWEQVSVSKHFVILF